MKKTRIGYISFLIITSFFHIFPFALQPTLRNVMNFTVKNFDGWFIQMSQRVQAYNIGTIVLQFKLILMMC